MNASSASYGTALGNCGKWNLIELIDDQGRYKYTKKVFIMSNLFVFRLYRARKADNQQKCLVKIFKKDSLEAQSEAKLLSLISHPRILAFSSNTTTEFDLNPEETSTFMMLEFEDAPRDALLSLIAAFHYFPKFIARSYFHQIVEVVEYLHDLNICHLNINPASIFLDEQYSIKLAGFDRAKQLIGSEYVDSSVIPEILDPSFDSPEIRQNISCNGYLSDVFSLGMVLFLMISGALPFSSATKDDELYQLIVNEKFDEFWAYHEDEMKSEFNYPTDFFDKDFRDLINKMLCSKESDRMSLKDIKESVWYKQHTLEGEKLTDFVIQVTKKMCLY